MQTNAQSCIQHAEIYDEPPISQMGEADAKKAANMLNGIDPVTKSWSSRPGD
jgi:hypothetical protein